MSLKRVISTDGLLVKSEDCGLKLWDIRQGCGRMSERPCGQVLVGHRLRGSVYASPPATRPSAESSWLCPTKGVKSLKKQPQLKPITIFIAPPSLADLKTRLGGRGTETEESMRGRLGIALREIEYAQVSEWRLQLQPRSRRVILVFGLRLASTSTSL